MKATKKMPLIDIGDAELSYEEYGSGDEVILSSAMGFRGWAYPELLADEPSNYRVITIQARGFGKSTHMTEVPAKGWLAQWADDVCAVADKLGIERFIYTGISHGGGIGWYIAQRNPDRLKALISVVGTPHDRLGGTDSSELRRKVIENRFDPVVLREQLEIGDGWSDDPVRLAEREETYPLYIQEHLDRPDSEAWINQGKPFPEAQTDEELEKILSGIHVPVLILAAMRDGIISPESALRAVKHVRGAKGVFFEDEGHAMGTESPERLAREVRLYIDELNGVALPLRPERPKGRVSIEKSSV
jgi:pimeloyl-ACP methyl ester carboxylesterase